MVTFSRTYLVGPSSIVMAEPDFLQKEYEVATKKKFLI